MAKYEELTGFVALEELTIEAEELLDVTGAGYATPTGVCPEVIAIGMGI